MSRGLRRFLIGVVAALKLWSITATAPETEPSDEDLARERHHAHDADPRTDHDRSLLQGRVEEPSIRTG